MLRLQIVEDLAANPGAREASPVKVIQVSIREGSADKSASLNLESVRLLFEEEPNVSPFLGESPSTPLASTPDGEVVSPQLTSENTEPTNRNLYKFLKILKSHEIDLEREITLNSDGILVVISDLHFIRAASWEVLRNENDPISRKLKIIRQVTKVAAGPDRCDGNNCLFLLSHGYIDGHTTPLHKVSNDFEKEISPSLERGYFDNRKERNGAQLLDLSLHGQELHALN